MSVDNGEKLRDKTDRGRGNERGREGTVENMAPLLLDFRETILIFERTSRGRVANFIKP